MNGPFKVRAELPNLSGESKAEMRHAANTFNPVGLVSTVAKRQANDHEGLVALSRY